MPRLLCLETSTAVCSVCCGDDTGLIHLSEVNRKNSHTETITLQIEECIKALSWQYSDLDAVVVGAGPGSYTGLRVGASAAKGIAYALGIPLISVSSLKGLANGIKDKSTPEGYLMPMIDARRMEVYTALYDHNLEEIKGTHSLILENLTLEAAVKNRQVLVCGNGAEKVKKIMYPENVEIFSTECSAKNLLPIGLSYYREEKFEDLKNYDPTYYKKPNVTKSKKKYF